jgi:23S rRNA (uracil1939-C5)-methyltransferase
MTNQTESEKPLSVQWLNAAGQGGGRHNNQTVTVSGVLPGETIHWTPLKGSGRTIRGRLVDIVEPSAWRAVPRCPYQASCGGCDMAHLAPPGRGHFFPAIAARTLGFAGEVLWIASPRQTGHRARIKLSIIDGQLGYLKENTHSLVPITQCEIARPEVQDVLKRLSAPRTYGTAKSIEIRSDGNRVALDIISPKEALPAHLTSSANLSMSH